MKTAEPKANDVKTKADDPELSGVEEAPLQQHAGAMQSTAFSGILGHVNFDRGAADNTILEAIAAPDHQKHFRREVYVGIKDTQQNIEFLGRIIQGPFHAPHEAGTTSKARKKAHRSL